jgi:anti-sigma regulatory factor (Ser/Thr protein kinase)
MTEERIELPPERASIPRARHFARAVVGSDRKPEVLELIELLTSELVTNAVLHSGTACELRVFCAAGGMLRVEVADGSSRRPQLRTDVDPLALNGRGLQFVEQLATRWGVERRPPGKVVWFELAS